MLRSHPESPSSKMRSFMHWMGWTKTDGHSFHRFHRGTDHWVYPCKPLECPAEGSDTPSQNTCWIQPIVPSHVEWTKNLNPYPRLSSRTVRELYLPVFKKENRNRIPGAQCCPSNLSSLFSMSFPSCSIHCASFSIGFPSFSNGFFPLHFPIVPFFFQ